MMKQKTATRLRRIASSPELRSWKPELTLPLEMAAVVETGIALGTITREQEIQELSVPWERHETKAMRTKARELQERARNAPVLPHMTPVMKWNWRTRSMYWDGCYENSDLFVPKNVKATFRGRSYVYRMGRCIKQSKVNSDWTCIHCLQTSSVQRYKGRVFYGDPLWQKKNSTWNFPIVPPLPHHIAEQLSLLDVTLVYNNQGVITKVVT